MNSLKRKVLHLFISIAFSCVVYELLGYVLDKLSEGFERGKNVRNIIETLLVILYPGAFGLLVFVLLVAASYWCLQRKQTGREHPGTDHE